MHPVCWSSLPRTSRTVECAYTNKSAFLECEDTCTMRTSSQTINAIKGCLQYLRVDAEGLGLARTSYLISLAIADLEEAAADNDAGESNVRHRVH